MLDDQFSPEEEQFIQELRNISKPQLDLAKRNAIREQMLSEFRTLHTPQPVRPRFSVPQVLALVAVVVVVILGIVLILQTGVQSNNLNLNPTLETQVAIAPSEALPHATSTMTPTRTETPTSTPILEMTDIPVSNTPTLFSTATPVVIVPTLMPEVIVVIEGPVDRIGEGELEIYDFIIEVEPQHPILQVINVGDIVRVQGTYAIDGAVIASVISNIPEVPMVEGDATVGLDGPIEEINGNELVINGITVQLEQDDPILQTLQVGNFITVQGNFEVREATIVLVVVNISVVNTTVPESNCWYHEGGMGMGHWHCDGMGMGGMGMGDAMGMGN